VAEVERPVWYADSDDPYFTLRHSGGPMVLCALLPMILVFCFAGGRGGWAFLFIGALVPFAVVAAIWEFVLDRRSVVEMRLGDGELTVLRADRSTATYPARDVKRIEMTQRISGGVAASSRMRLQIGDRVERTRHGPGELPSRFAEAITVAEIDLDVKEKIDND
jgi:hypothetical protein